MCNIFLVDIITVKQKQPIMDIANVEYISAAETLYDIQIKLLHRSPQHRYIGNIEDIKGAGQMHRRR